MNYKPFDLEAAKAGAPIICRNGTRPIGLHLFEVPHKPYPLLVAHEDGTILAHAITGAYDNDVTEGSRDLFMAPVKRTAWVNVWEDDQATEWRVIHKTREDANKSGDYRYKRIACIEIEYEEGQGL